MPRMAGIASPMIRELPEMQYQFRRPCVLDFVSNGFWRTAVNHDQLCSRAVAGKPLLHM